jgi:hypothetical protein
MARIFEIDSIMEYFFFAARAGTSVAYRRHTILLIKLLQTEKEIYDRLACKVRSTIKEPIWNFSLLSAE